MNAVEGDWSQLIVLLVGSFENMNWACLEEEMERVSRRISFRNDKLDR